MKLEELNAIVVKYNLDLIDYGYNDYGLIGLWSADQRDTILAENPGLTCAVVVKRKGARRWEWSEYADHVTITEEMFGCGDNAHFERDADNWLALFDPDEQEQEAVRETAEKLRQLGPDEVCVMVGDDVVETLKTKDVTFHSEDGWKWEVALIPETMEEADDEPKLRIREAMAQAGLTLSEVARRMGKTPNTLVKIIGMGSPSFRSLVAIAKAIGCPVTELIVLPEEDLKAIIYYRGERITLKSLQELQQFVDELTVSE